MHLDAASKNRVIAVQDLQEALQICKSAGNITDNNSNAMKCCDLVQGA